MKDEVGSADRKDQISPEELAWAVDNMPMLRRWLAGQKFLRDALLFVFVLGLAAHVAGYVVISARVGEPWGLVADLLATLGTTLWTGVVLVLFVEIMPAARRRWLSERLDAYETVFREQDGVNGAAGRAHDRPTTRP